ncbi:MAG: WD40 repeat domain-containing protein [Campylobacterota bacterium]|nr:WD40 repeat domain-containing protein [Campylobacterota bacterium]
MHKLLISFAFLFTLVSAKEIHPTFKLKSMGLVNDFVVVQEKIYIANDEGTVDIFDLTTQKLVEQIVLEPITSSRRQLLPPNILSVDYLNGKVLMVTTGVEAYKNVWIYENHQLTKVISEEKKLTLKEARFADDEKIILGTFGSEIMLHDSRENYNLYKEHVSQSTLGDIELSEDKSKIIISDESGEIKLMDAKTSQILKIFSSQNVDNVYKVAYANGVIITAGQDRRVAVYQDGEKDYHIKSDFLVYSVGITPSGKIGVYSSGEESDLQLFNTKTKEKLDRLVGHEGIINNIKFINEKELFSSERSRYVYYWRLD